MGVSGLGVEFLAALALGVFVPFLALIGLGGLRRLKAGVLDDLALDALAIAAAARIAVARTAARLERFSLSSSASRWARSSASISA